MQKLCIDFEWTSASDSKYKGSSSVAQMGPKKSFDCYYCGIRGHLKPECRRRKADMEKGIFRESLPGVKTGARRQPGVDALQAANESAEEEKPSSTAINSINNAEEPSDPALIYGRLCNGRKIVVWPDTAAQNTIISKQFVDNNDLQVFNICCQLM